MESQSTAKNSLEEQLATWRHVATYLYMYLSED